MSEFILYHEAYCVYACIRFLHAELGSLNRISKFTWSLSTQIFSQNRELENHSEVREKENPVDEITK